MPPRVPMVPEPAGPLPREHQRAGVIVPVARGLKAKPQHANLASLLSGADGGEQALHRVQCPVSVVGGECLAVRPPVAGLAQFAGEALLSPGKLVLEGPPLLGHHPQQEPRIRQ